ncbi:histidine kinase [Streptomyces sp. NPDC004610]|uniref:sensor histidine kinase n=1 Tax=unclassified Streptomyces TaxID=2593676 RepID=UPI0033A58AB1
MDESGAWTSPSGRRIPPAVWDVLLAVTVVVAGLVMVGRPGTSEGRPVTGQDLFVAVVVFALVLARRRCPLLLLGVSAGLTIVGVAAGNSLSGFIAGVVVCACTGAAQADRRAVWPLAGAAAAAVYGAIVVCTDEIWLGPPLGVVALIGMATALGDATRSRRAYVTAVRERALRAERTREEEAHRRVGEERLRIARDLHDLVAHHIAVINVHAGLAEHTLRTHQDRAEESLGLVRQAAQSTLGELATILSLLRQTDDAEAPTEPIRSLAQLGELLRSAAAAGLRVEHRASEPGHPLPGTVDQAAYRIVQEALTNAHKHGAGECATLRIEYRPDAVVLDIDNPVSSAPVPAGESGHGLIGMRERVNAVGGILAAGPVPGRFRVHAVLPMATRSEGSS